MIEGPLHWWGLDFNDPINPPSNAGHIYIITTIDYFTKWVEENPTKKTTSEVVCEFLKEKILIRFEALLKLVMDNPSYFSSVEIVKFC